jgi:low temperature requirement protein LtrA
MVVVVAYLVVRVIHLSMYVVAAGDDVELRHQVAISWLPLLASAVLLVVGALVGGAAQTALFAVALAGEWLSVYLTSRHGSWRVRSVSHWTERYGLFVIIAIGESIVAIGTGAADAQLTTGLLAASALGVAMAICLWWLYFDVVAIAAEQAMDQADERRRLAIALEGYTYGHYALVAGIVLAALGVELALEALGDDKAVGVFAAVALLAGLALHLAGHVWFKARVLDSFSVSRTVGAAVLLGAIPLVAQLRAGPALAVPTTILVALIVRESVYHRAVRHRIREGWADSATQH